MDTKAKIAERVRIARERAGLTQAQAAQMMGFHRPTISEIEAGRRNVKVEELNRFAEIYCVDSSWISGEEREVFTEDIIAAARELSSMKSEDLELLLGTIKMLKNKSGKVE